MILTVREQIEINARFKRIAFDYAMAALSGDNAAEIVTNVRYHAMSEILNIIGGELTIPFDANSLLHVGNKLYRDGYRRESGKLVKRNNTVVSEI